MQQPDDIIVYNTLSAMRQLASQVPRRFHRYVAGVVPLDRAERMVRKFMDLYGIGEPRALEHRRRRRYGAIVRLVICPDGRLEDHRLRWVMIVSDKGGGRARAACGRKRQTTSDYHQLVRTGPRTPPRRHAELDLEGPARRMARACRARRRACAAWRPDAGTAAYRP